MDNLLDEIKRLQEESVRYKNRREKDEALINALTEIREIINKVLGDIVIKTVKQRSEGKPGKYDEIINDLYNEMKTGAYIGVDDIEKKYPELSRSNAMTLYSKLKKGSGVGKTTTKPYKLYMIKEY